MKNEEWELHFLILVKREKGEIALTEYKKLQLNKRITADNNNSQQTTIIHNRQSHPPLSTEPSILWYNHPSLSTESSIFIYNHLNLHITNFIYILMNARMRAIQPDNDINNRVGGKH